MFVKTRFRFLARPVFDRDISCVRTLVLKNEGPGKILQVGDLVQLRDHGEVLKDVRNPQRQ